MRFRPIKKSWLSAKTACPLQYNWRTDPDPGLDPIPFVSGLPRSQKIIFYLLLFEGTFASFLKDKKSQRSHKTVEMKVFLLFLLDDGRIRVHTNNDTSGSGRSKTYATYGSESRSASTTLVPPLWQERTSIFFAFNLVGKNVGSKTSAIRGEDWSKKSGFS